MSYANLRPSQVVLDPENPRLPDGTSSDREAINRLLDDGADALVNLARDMARTGQTNPAELPIAVKFNSKYLVLEGNRRFAALKLLKDPSLADDEEHQKAFRRAAGLGVPPKSVYTLISASREEAEHWIFLRHTGENNGMGVKRWSAGQTAIHRQRANRTVDSGTLRSISIADELEEAYAADEEIVELVRRVRREKLTNIGRFFSPDVLITLHFKIMTVGDSSLGNRVLLVRHTPDQLREFFLWALTYIQSNSVDAYKNSDVRREALRIAGSRIPDPALASEEAFRLADVPRGGPESASNTSDDEEESEPEMNDSDTFESTETHGSSDESASSESTSTSHGRFKIML